ncbi:serine/threonine protein kinase [Murinocardiopsis flavida]|uniref:Serine/threonine protein kinase n=1 Tax=Murinocardiopsis flavida TaxID=645275 RepID=A0A2P8D5A0_9ACTN|nr:serine/threonine-protein kinase [Murinocardiopsis flavida]PSK92372.1 serine/threonine protein kinase [Murinocardiopsis flavida]
MIARGRRRLDRLRPGDPEEVGPCRIVGRVGTGGMGTVFAGTMGGRAGYLAVKVIHPEYAADPGFRRRFAREARLLVRVNSRCVPRFVRADVEAERPWLVTEYVPGPTLRRQVERFGALRGGMLLGLAAGAAEALRAVHGAGIVHRDLKPGNVVMAPGGPKVLDFGIAHAPEDATRWLRLRRGRGRVRALGLADSPALTEPLGAFVPTGRRRGDRVGTPGWISPEQYRGGPATPRSDVFLWGALVAFAAGRKDPFGHGSPREMAFRVLREEPDLEGLPDGLAALVGAAMAKRPEDRPEPAALLSTTLGLAGADDVRGLLADVWTRVSAPPPRPPRRPLLPRWG